MAVMPALVAGIHDLTAPVAKKTWMAGPSPAMTEEGARVKLAMIARAKSLLPPTPRAHRHRLPAVTTTQLPDRATVIDACVCVACRADQRTVVRRQAAYSMDLAVDAFS